MTKELREAKRLNKESKELLKQAMELLKRAMEMQPAVITITSPPLSPTYVGPYTNLPNTGPWNEPVTTPAWPVTRPTIVCCNANMDKLKGVMAYNAPEN